MVPLSFQTSASNTHYKRHTGRKLRSLLWQVSPWWGFTPELHYPNTEVAIYIEDALIHQLDTYGGRHQPGHSTQAPHPCMHPRPQIATSEKTSACLCLHAKAARLTQLRTMINVHPHASQDAHKQPCILTCGSHSSEAVTVECSTVVLNIICSLLQATQCSKETVCFGLLVKRGFCWCLIMDASCSFSAPIHHDHTLAAFGAEK